MTSRGSVCSYVSPDHAGDVRRARIGVDGGGGDAPASSHTSLPPVTPLMTRRRSRNVMDDSDAADASTPASREGASSAMAGSSVLGARAASLARGGPRASTGSLAASDSLRRATARRAAAAAAAQAATRARRGVVEREIAAAGARAAAGVAFKPTEHAAWSARGVQSEGDVLVLPDAWVRTRRAATHSDAHAHARRRKRGWRLTCSPERPRRLTARPRQRVQVTPRWWRERGVTARVRAVCAAESRPLQALRRGTGRAGAGDFDEAEVRRVSASAAQPCAHASVRCRRSSSGAR